MYRVKQSPEYISMLVCTCVCELYPRRGLAVGWVVCSLLARRRIVSTYGGVVRGQGQPDNPHLCRFEGNVTKSEISPLCFNCKCDGNHIRRGSSSLIPHLHGRWGLPSPSVATATKLVPRSSLTIPHIVEGGRQSQQH